MPVRYRRPPELPAVTLPEEQLRYFAGLLDGLGTLRTLSRANGQEVVRLTVVNLSASAVDRLRAGFGVGSRLGNPNAAGRGLTWSVEGRWACLRVAKELTPFLDGESPLHRAFVTLLVTDPPPPAMHCDVDGCGGALRARRLCRRHLYAAEKLGLTGPARHGRPDACPVCGDRQSAGPTDRRPHLCDECAAALAGAASLTEGR